MSNFEHVKKFMKTFGQEVKEKAEFPSNKIISLRYDLIREELDELKDAIEKKDIKEVADALTDILWCWTCFWNKFRQMFCRGSKLKYEQVRSGR